MILNFKKKSLVFLLLILLPMMNLLAQEKQHVMTDGSYFEGEKIDSVRVGEWSKFDVNGKLRQRLNYNSVGELDGAWIQFDEHGRVMVAANMIDNGVSEYLIFKAFGAIHVSAEFDELLPLKTFWKLINLNKYIHPHWDDFSIFKVVGSGTNAIIIRNAYEANAEDESSQELLKYIRKHDETIFRSLMELSGTFSVYQINGGYNQAYITRKYIKGEPLETIRKEFHPDSEKVSSELLMINKILIEKKEDIEDDENYTQIYFYENGEIKSKGKIKDGQKKGKWKFYDEKGNLVRKEKFE